MTQLEEKLAELEIPAGKFALLGGSETGHGFSSFIYNTLEEAKAVRDKFISMAPEYASPVSSLERGKDYNPEALMSPEQALSFLEMSFHIYNDQKQLVD